MFSVAYPIALETESTRGEEHGRKELIGCILWLKAVNLSKDHVQYGLRDKACNHPCLVVDVSPKNQADFEDFRLTICIITSFKNMTSEGRAIAVLKPSLIPIFPNDVAATSSRRIQLQTGSRLKRDSWIQTANSYHVPMDLLDTYDRRYPPQHFKLTASSITYIRDVLALPPMLRNSGATIPPVQRTLPHQSVSGPSTSSNSRKIEAIRQDRLICTPLDHIEETRSLVPNGVRCGQYGTYVSFYPNTFERDHQSIAEEQHHVHQPVVEPWWRRKNLDEENLMSPFTQRVQSHRQARSWLPSKETVTRILFVTLVLAVSGGFAYVGFRLLKFLYVILAQGYHDLVVVTVKVLTAVRGAWHKGVDLVRGIGQMVVKVEGGVAKAVARVVGAVKALWGRVWVESLVGV